MTLLSTVMAFFPASVMLLAAMAVSVMFMASTWTMFGLGFVGLLLSFYAYPLMTFHVLQKFKPMPGTHEALDAKKYSCWWGLHQVQLIYFIFPVLEKILKAIPGLFSAWLRLWGSKVGKNVYWTVTAEIHDRHLLDIGDGVIFGHEVRLICHVVGPHEGKMSMYANTITIGKRAFVGAGAILGPGVVIDPRIFLAAKTEGLPDRHFTEDTVFIRQPQSNPEDVPTSA